MLLFLEDVRVASVARRRALPRPEADVRDGRADANLVTLVWAAAVVDAAGRGAARLSAPAAPAPANVALSAAAGGSALSAVAGTPPPAEAAASWRSRSSTSSSVCPQARSRAGSRAPRSGSLAVMQQAQRLAADRLVRAKRPPSPPLRPRQRR